MRFRPRFLPVFALIPALFCFPTKAQEETWAQQIAGLEADFRRAPRARTLGYLAEAREAARQWDKAQSSWDYLARRFGDGESHYFGHNSDQNRLTFAQLAPWMKNRIARKRNLERSGGASPNEKGRALRASMRFMDPPPVAHLDAYRTIEMDGDGIEEIIVYGRAGESPSSKRNSMAIWKWNGKEYLPIWSQYANLPSKVEYADHNTEWNNLSDGFLEVVLMFSGKEKRVQTLSYNGRDIISTIVR